MRDNRTEFRVTTMSRVLSVHRSGFYAWLKKPDSERAAENLRLVSQIRHYWEESDRTYGSPRIHKDLREAGERCGVNRVARLMNEHGIQAYLALKKRRYRGGRAALTLNRCLGIFPTARYELPPPRIRSLEYCELRTILKPAKWDY